MLIIAQHAINDPENFWNAAKEVTQNLPSGMSLHAVYPAMDSKSGTCLWEADSVSDVQSFLDENAGKFAKNTCYEVNASAAMGLPTVALKPENAN